jgi:hypothetical protein
MILSGWIGMTIPELIRRDAASHLSSSEVLAAGRISMGSWWRRPETARGASGRVAMRPVCQEHLGKGAMLLNTGRKLFLPRAC